MQKRNFFIGSKSQGALEYLMTYAWAILVVVIIMSAMAYFGFLRPSKMFPDRCDFPSVFKCEAFEITYGQTGSDGQVRFQLINNVGHDIKIDSVEGVYVGGDAINPFVCLVNDLSTPQLYAKWADRTLKDFASTSDCHTEDVQFSKGKKGKVIVKIKYHKVGADNFIHDADGEIYSTVR